MTRELHIDHGGHSYVVLVEFDTRTVDDSFDGHEGGVRHTFKRSHVEPDTDSITVESCTDEDGCEVEVTDGLMALIRAKVEALTITP